MLVFTSDYVERLRERWKSRKERDWPLIVRIALQDRRQDDRDRIEAYVDRLHPDDHAKIIRSLQSEKQFGTAFGELIVGQLLGNVGLAPRYEPELVTAAGKRTPDWYVGGSFPFVCDVFTAGLPQERDADEKSLREIEARLSEIRAAYTVRLEVPSAGDLDAGGRRNVASRTAQWLATKPQKGESIVIGNAIVEVMLLGGVHVVVIPTEPMHVVETPTKLRENFEEKTKRYAPLGFPVIAAAVKHPLAETDAIEVEDVLLGQIAIVSRETTSGRIVSRTERLPNGIFASRPELSAAVWIEPHHLPEPVVQMWNNPAANKPIPENLLRLLTAATM